MQSPKHCVSVLHDNLAQFALPEYAQQDCILGQAFADATTGAARARMPRPFPAASDAS